MSQRSVAGVVVTGAGGFVGGAIARRLAAAPLGPCQRLILVDRVPIAAPPDARTIVGDLGDAATVDAIAAAGPSHVFHLAAIPGGASEAEPRTSRRVNLDASLALIEMLSAHPGRPRLLYASSIGVFGVPLPPAVDDDTVARPTLTYGTHKLMVETAIADAVRRGDLDALAVRLPGLVARPGLPSGLKSAFMSELFHRLRAHDAITVPVGADGHVWIASIGRCVDNLIAAATVDWEPLGERRAITLPALRVRIGELATAIATQTGAAANLVAYAPEPALEAQFAAYPPLATPAAEAIGLTDDGDVATLVERALAELRATA